MSPRLFAFIAATLVTAMSVTAMSVTPALAQTKPMHSGHMSHGAPQMKKHGSGVHHPNRPHYHHHFGHAGYRPVHSHTM